MRPFTVFIVDDNTEWRTNLCQYFREDDGFLIVGEASDGNEASMFLHDARPDILIVDIIMPNRSGIGLLNYLHVMMPDYQPFIYILTGFDSVEHETAIRDFKPDCYSLKTIHPSHIVSNIKKLMAVRGKDHIVVKTTEKQRSVWLPGIMRQLGVPIHLTSTKRTMDLLETYVSRYESGEKDITGQELYATMAKQLGTTPGAVERGVRSTINYMLKADSVLFQKIFRFELKMGITNMMFLSMLGLYISSLSEEDAKVYDQFSI